MVHYRIGQVFSQRIKSCIPQQNRGESTNLDWASRIYLSWIVERRMNYRMGQSLSWHAWVLKMSLVNQNLDQDLDLLSLSPQGLLDKNRSDFVTRVVRRLNLKARKSSTSLDISKVWLGKTRLRILHFSPNRPNKLFAQAREKLGHCINTSRHLWLAKYLNVLTRGKKSLLEEEEYIVAVLREFVDLKQTQMNRANPVLRVHSFRKRS